MSDILDKVGAYWVEQARREFNRRLYLENLTAIYAESLRACYRSGQMSEAQWQAHIAAGEVKP